MISTNSLFANLQAWQGKKRERNHKKCNDEKVYDDWNIISNWKKKHFNAGIWNQSSMHAIDNSNQMRHFRITFHKHCSRAIAFNLEIMADLLLLIALCREHKKKKKRKQFKWGFFLMWRKRIHFIDNLSFFLLVFVCKCVQCSVVSFIKFSLWFSSLTGPVFNQLHAYKNHNWKSSYVQNVLVVLVVVFHASFMNPFPFVQFAFLFSTFSFGKLFRGHIKYGQCCGHVFKSFYLHIIYIQMGNCWFGSHKSVKVVWFPRF